jgi:hypothetical protein
MRSSRIIVVAERLSNIFSRGYTPDQVARIVGKSLDTIMSCYYEEASEDDIIMRTKQFMNV